MNASQDFLLKHIGKQSVQIELLSEQNRKQAIQIENLNEANEGLKKLLDGIAGQQKEDEKETN